MKYTLVFISLLFFCSVNGQETIYKSSKHNCSVEFPKKYLKIGKEALCKYYGSNYYIIFDLLFIKDMSIDKYKKKMNKNRFKTLKEEDIFNNDIRVYNYAYSVNIMNVKMSYDNWLIEIEGGVIKLMIFIDGDDVGLPDLSYVYPFLYSFKFPDGSSLPIKNNIPIANRKYGGPLIGNGVDPFEVQIQQQPIANIQKSKESQDLDINSNMINDDKQLLKSDIDSNIPNIDIVNLNTFAVIIGNEDYDNEINVNFAINDAKIFNEYVINTIGVPSEQVHLVLNASYGKILREIQWINNIAKAYEGNAKIIFYYAGHGMPDEKSKEAYIIPVDGDASQTLTAVSIDKLYNSLNEYPTEKTTVFIDACFSGGARDGMLASGRGVRIVPKEEKPNGNLVVFTAVSGSQTAHPYESKSHGLFSYYLMKKLQESKGKVTYGELSEYIKKEVNRKSVINGDEQTPQVNVSINLQDSWKDWTFE